MTSPHSTAGRVVLTRYEGKKNLPRRRTVVKGDLVHLLFDPDRRDDVGASAKGR